MPSYWQKRRVVQEAKVDIFYLFIQTIRTLLVGIGFLLCTALWFTLLIWNPIQVVRGVYPLTAGLVVAWILTALFTVWLIFRRLR